MMYLLQICEPWPAMLHTRKESVLTRSLVYSERKSAAVPLVKAGVRTVKAVQLKGLVCLYFYY